MSNISHTNLNFNPSPSFIMHIDLNSCFATVEQQANPLLRGKPIAVAAYNSPNGCILAPSIEAKTYGIKTGMRVKDGKVLYPKLIVLSPDPWKYRHVHLKLRDLLSMYSQNVVPKSIDEFVLNLEGFGEVLSKDVPCFCKEHPCKCLMHRIAAEIKKHIKSNIGEWLTVSIGISTNRYLAKIAAGLNKPDGLDEINAHNYLEIYKNLKLTDLTGIKTANALRLSSMGIYTVMDFLNAPLWRLKAAFRSITSLYWYQRLRGYEIDGILFNRSSYGNSTAIGKKVTSFEEASPIIARLTEKMSMRLRSAGYKARGIHLGILFRDGHYWHEGKMVDRELYDTRDFLKALLRLLMKASLNGPIVNIAVSAFSLVKNNNSQLDLFQNVIVGEKLTQASDLINKKWGDFSLNIGRSLDRKVEVLDRIAFGQPAEALPETAVSLQAGTHQALLAGGVKELEEFTLNNSNNPNNTNDPTIY